MIIEGKIKGSAGSKSIDFGVILGISLPVWVRIAMGVGLWGRLG